MGQSATAPSVLKTRSSITECLLLDDRRRHVTFGNGHSESGEENSRARPIGESSQPMSAGPRSLMQEWRTQSSRTVLEFGKFGSVESHTVQVPDGTVIEDWIWFKVRHDLIEMSSDDTDTVWQTPSFVNVLARDNELRKWVVFRQVKYGISVAMGGETLASVGGYIEQGEDPLDAAKRELQEELGYTSDNWVALTPSGIVAGSGYRCHRRQPLVTATTGIRLQSRLRCGIPVPGIGCCAGGAFGQP